MWLGEGSIGDAWRWAREHGLSAADDLTYLREFEYITLARVLLAQGWLIGPSAFVAAIGFADRLLTAAEAGGRDGSAIDILVVLALARDAADDRRAPPLRSLAPSRSPSRRATSAPSSTRVRRWRRCSGPWPRIGAHRATCGSCSPLDGDDPGETSPQQPLIEPLSERELEVLRLLDSDLDGPDIARELTVSLHTVRTHTRNIYSKFGVTSRRAAVRRGGELGLLSRGRGSAAQPARSHLPCPGSPRVGRSPRRPIPRAGDARSSHPLRLFDWADQPGVTGLHGPSRALARGAV